MRSRRRLVHLLSLALVLPATRVLADDVVCAGFLVGVNDPLLFEAAGSFSTQDTSEGAHPVNDGLPGGKASCELGTPNTNWQFLIEHYAASWSVAGVVDAGIGLAGQHLAPPGPSHAGENTNNLTRDGAALAAVASRFFLSPVQNWNFGKTTRHAISELKRHGVHTDSFSFTAEAVEAIQSPGPLAPAHSLSSGTRVKAEHKETKEETTEQTGKALGTNSASPSSIVTYDAVLETLYFSIGPIDTLDSVGGASGAIEPPYLGDPILEATWTVTPLVFLGQLPDGSYRFGPGSVTVAAAGSPLSLVGRFDSYRITDTTPQLPLTSVATLDEVAITDFGDLVDGPSPFLADFIETNLFGTGIPLPEQPFVQGMSFAFETDVDLVALTSGFTQSAFDVPARFTLAASRHDLSAPQEVPALPAWGWSALVLLLGAGALGSLRARR